MASHNVLRWRDGRGWLVLSGSSDNATDVRAQALGRVAADGAAVYVSLGNHDNWSDSALADMDDLGAPPGFIVDALTEDDQTIIERLTEAAIVVIEDAPDVSEVRSALLGAAVQGMQIAFENGAVILAEGNAAMVFGAWVVASEQVVSGLNWLEGALVVPGVTAVAQSEQAQQVLNAEPAAIAVGLGSGSALALGPDGEVEPWGGRQVTVALGPEFSGSKGG